MDDPLPLAAGTHGARTHGPQRNATGTVARWAARGDGGRFFPCDSGGGNARDPREIPTQAQVRAFWSLKSRSEGPDLMARACLCGRRAIEGETSCERHRRKHWRGGQRYSGSYDSTYASARKKLLAAAKANPAAVCGLCGRPAIEGDPWQPDHIMPVSRGGTSRIDNLQLAHTSCNRRRGSQLGAQRSGERKRAKRIQARPEP